MSPLFLPCMSSREGLYWTYQVRLRLLPSFPDTGTEIRYKYKEEGVDTCDACDTHGIPRIPQRTPVIVKGDLSMSFHRDPFQTVICVFPSIIIPFKAWPEAVAGGHGRKPWLTAMSNGHGRRPWPKALADGLDRRRWRTAVK